MGYYIDPANGTKEDFLRQEAEILVMMPPSVIAIPETKAIVCLVDNGDFKAAAIAYSDEELERFQRPDGRPKTWYLIDRKKLWAVSDIKPEYFQRPDGTVQAPSQEVSGEPDKQTGGK